MISKQQTSKPTFMISMTRTGFTLYATYATQLETVKAIQNKLRQLGMQATRIHMRRNGTGWRADVSAVLVGDGTNDDLTWMD